MCLFLYLIIIIFSIPFPLLYFVRYWSSILITQHSRKKKRSPVTLKSSPYLLTSSLKPFPSTSCSEATWPSRLSALVWGQSCPIWLAWRWTRCSRSQDRSLNSPWTMYALEIPAFIVHDLVCKLIWCIQKVLYLKPLSDWINMREDKSYIQIWPFLNKNGVGNRNNST